MAESQAIGRVHRFGQKERVTVTRYIVRKSIESVGPRPLYFLPCRQYYLPACSSRSPSLSNGLQYVQWIQADKMRLISRSIENEQVSQGEVDAKRWQVSC